MRYSIAKPQQNAGLPIPRSGLLLVAAINDVKKYPGKISGKLQASEPVLFTDGVKWSTIYRTPTSHKATRDMPGDTYQKLFGAKLSGKYPGDDESADLFLAAHINQGFVVLDVPCEGIPKLYGRPGNPMILSADYQDDQNGSGHNLNFEKAFPDDLPYLLYPYPAEFFIENASSMRLLASDSGKALMFPNEQFLNVK